MSETKTVLQCSLLRSIECGYDTDDVVIKTYNKM